MFHLRCSGSLPAMSNCKDRADTIAVEPVRFNVSISFALHHVAAAASRTTNEEDRPSAIFEKQKYETARN
jgi:hypothetical protein